MRRQRELDERGIVVAWLFIGDTRSPAIREVAPFDYFLDRRVPGAVFLPTQHDRAARPQVDLGRIAEPFADMFRQRDDLPHAVRRSSDHDLSLNPAFNHDAL